MAIIIKRDNIDWAEKYAALQDKANMPGIANTYTKSIQYIHRELVVKIPDLLVKLNSLPVQPAIIYIIADVVYMPKEWHLMNQAIIIMTRRVVYPETGSTVNFDLHDKVRKNAASFTLFANEVMGNVVGIMSYAQGTSKWLRVEEYTGIGIQFARDNSGHLALNHLTNADLLPFNSGGKHGHVTAELQMGLSCQFQMASFMIDTDNAAARSILDWIKTASTKSLLLQGLYLQSSTLLAELSFELSKVNFVPVLSAKVYEDMADGFLASVKEYEAQYQNFSRASASKEDQVKAAKAMLVCLKGTTTFTDGLLAQAKSNVTAAQTGLSNAQKSMQTASLDSKLASRRFDIGIAKWKEEQKLKAAFEICVALISFGASVGQMFMGDPTAAATAGGAVASAAGAAAAGAAVAKDASAFNKAMKNLEKSMSSLKKIGKLLSGTGAFIEKVYAVALAMDKTTKINIDDFIFTSSDDISAQAEWDIFRLQADDMMKCVETEGIEGAQEYRQSLDIISIYGKAQAASQSALLVVTQELARLCLQKNTNLLMEEAITTYIADIEKGVVTNQKAMHDVFVLQMNMKRFMFNAVRNYTRAHKYWSLIDSKIKPSLLRSATDLQADVAMMKHDYFEALNNFDGALQDYGSNDNYAFEIKDAATLKSFKETGIISFTPPFLSDIFAGMNRVRVRRVRAWIHGLPERPVHLLVTNSGVYADRFKREEFTFSSKASVLTFKYMGAAGVAGGISIDGEVAKEVQGAYFQPTPFTGWRISLSSHTPFTEDERGKVTKIVLTFAGTEIGDTTLYRKLQAKMASSEKLATVDAES